MGNLNVQPNSRGVIKVIGGRSASPPKFTFMHLADTLINFRLWIDTGLQGVGCVCGGEQS